MVGKIIEKKIKLFLWLFFVGFNLIYFELGLFLSKYFMTNNFSLEKVKRIFKKGKITPNLTVYYPLPSSILSVSIRFMGTILLLLLYIFFNLFLFTFIFAINFKILSSVSFFIGTICLQSSIHHVLSSGTHFLRVNQAKNVN